MSPPSKLALAAARMALRCAGLPEPRRPARRRVYGRGAGYRVRSLHQHRGPPEADPLENPEAGLAILFTESVANAPAAQIAIAVKARGASLTVCQREAGPLIALGTAAAEIAAGRAGCVLAGAVDEMTPLLHAILDRFGALARPGPDGEEEARPFGRRRNGFLAGEGATVAVLESEASLAARESRPWRGSSPGAAASIPRRRLRAGAGATRPWPAGCGALWRGRDWIPRSSV